MVYYTLEIKLTVKILFSTVTTSISFCFSEPVEMKDYNKLYDCLCKLKAD